MSAKSTKEPYLPYQNKDGAFSDEKIMQEELDEYISKRRESYEQIEPTDKNLTGLALSGGGIRSATFCLGVMQALAREGIMKRFDYLSTVSGGGYIGSSLTWILHSKWAEGKQRKEAYDDSNAPKIRFGVSVDDFPYGTKLRNRDADPHNGADKGDKVELSGDDYRGAAILRYLRQHGNYLTPGDGITFLSLVGVILRGMFISIMVFLPWLLLVFFLLAENGWFTDKVYGDVTVFTFSGLALFATFLVLSIVYAVLTRWSSKTHKVENSSYKSAWSRITVWYKLRREYEKWVPYLLALGAALLLLGWLPDLTELIAKLLQPNLNKADITIYIANDTKGPLMALLSTIGGVLAAMASFFKSGKEDQGKLSTGLLAFIASVLLTLGLFVGTYYMAIRVAESSNIDAGWYLALGVAVTSFIGWLASINYLSIHRYYRDRLMESYLPDVGRVLAGSPGPSQASPLADIGALKDMCAVETEDPKDSAVGPYHLINANVILVESGINKYRGRGGDNFLLSPRFCGSNATGWHRTESYMGGDLTLSTAMAISGAAANPNTGIGGEGPTRQPLLSRLMVFLNLGLGVWVSNPDPQCHRWAKVANFLSPGSWPLLPWKKLTEKESFLQLSDGGHFENLGIYELIRRHLKLIVVCDAGADPDFQFGDLANAIEKVRTDFGVCIEFEEGLSPLIPSTHQACRDAQDAKRDVQVPLLPSLIT
ncbi:MAG: patatin-like phospholipase family protein, partial [Chromatiales bacterium]